MLMWLEPGPRPRGGRRWAETWSWHREERAPFAQLFTSFSHELLGLEEVSEMIWSDLFHCNDEETAQRFLSNLLKSAHKSDRAGVKTCVPWVIAQLRPLRAKCADFWTSRNVPECFREGPLLWFFLIHQSDLEMAKLIYLMKEDMVCQHTACQHFSAVYEVGPCMFSSHLLGTRMLMENPFCLNSVSWYKLT